MVDATLAGGRGDCRLEFLITRVVNFRLGLSYSCHCDMYKRRAKLFPMKGHY